MVLSSWLRAAASREIVRYGVVGALSFGCDFGVLTLTVSGFGLHYLLGAFCGFVVGLAVNFLVAERFVFGAPKVTSAALRFGNYAVIGVVGLGLLELLMYIQVDHFGWNYLVAKAVATVIGYLWNYFARRVMYLRRTPPVVEIEEGDPRWVGSGQRSSSEPGQPG
jgi:putative flippase GtrA